MDYDARCDGELWYNIDNRRKYEKRRDKCSFGDARRLYAD